MLEMTRFYSFSSKRLCFSSLSLTVMLLCFFSPVQAINDVWRKLDLPDNNEMMDMMTHYQMKEHEDHTTSLSSRSGGEAKLAERCGSRNACSKEEDLQCTRAVMGKRCQPVNCLQRGLQQFQATFDMQEYKQLIFQHAGITEGELRQEVEDARKGDDEKTSFQQSRILQAIKQAMDQYSAPADAIFSMYDQCTNVNGTNQDPYDLQRVNYQGVHFEAGAILDGALDFFWENSSGAGFVRYCIGATGIGGAEVSFLYLIAQMTNDTEAIAKTCHLRADVNFGVLLNLGVGYAYGFNNALSQLELTAGLGVSVAAGLGVCGVSKL